MHPGGAAAAWKSRSMVSTPAREAVNVPFSRGCDGHGVRGHHQVAAPAGQAVPGFFSGPGLLEVICDRRKAAASEPAQCLAPVRATHSRERVLRPLQHVSLEPRDQAILDAGHDVVDGLPRIVRVTHRAPVHLVVRAIAHRFGRRDHARLVVRITSRHPRAGHHGDEPGQLNADTLHLLARAHDARDPRECCDSREAHDHLFRLSVVERSALIWRNRREQRDRQRGQRVVLGPSVLHGLGHLLERTLTGRRVHAEHRNGRVLHGDALGSAHVLHRDVVKLPIQKDEPAGLLRHGDERRLIARLERGGGELVAAHLPRRRVDHPLRLTHRRHVNRDDHSIIQLHVDSSCLVQSCWNKSEATLAHVYIKNKISP